MKLISLVILIICCLFSRLTCALPWEIWNSPYQLATLDARDQIFLRSSYCPDGCRYDRTNRGPEAPASNLYPERWLYRDGMEAVVFEDNGPGAITRIWMTSGFGVSQSLPMMARVRFYLDGAAQPALDLPLSALFDGTTVPFTPPLTLSRLSSSGGYINYFPFSYAHGIRVTLLNADSTLLWFQFSYHRLPLDSVVSSFTPGTDVPAWRSFLGHRGDDPWNGMLPVQVSSVTLNPGEALPIATRSGPAWLRGLRLHLPRSAYSQVRLQLRFDDELRVDVPLADFFATPVAAIQPARGVLLGEDISNWLYSWIPMPFRRQAEVLLLADPALPAAINVDAEIIWDTAAIDKNASLFQTILNDSCPTIAGQDNVLFSTYGAGRVIGVAATYHAYGFANREYLEGDERIYRDGSAHPVWYGTGVEDFYNAGFYFDQGAYAQPLAGASLLDTDGNGVTTAYRLLLNDYWPYQAQLRVYQENGGNGQLPMCARSTVYAYSQRQAQLVPYARLEVGDSITTTRYSYQPGPGASCAMLTANYGDEPATPRTARVCRFVSGSSTFHFVPQAAAAPLRLRRIFDATVPGQMAEIWVNGALAGKFPYTAANSVRRWQEQDVVLNTPIGNGDFQIEIRPVFASPDGASEFSESAYELWGRATDLIFHDDYELP